MPPDGGFVVRRERYPEVRLTVTPHLADYSVQVDYVFASMTGIAAPKARKLVLADLNGCMWVFRDEPSDAFRNATELSEYLLVPVVRGQLA
jgi:hypothetical protein